MGFNLGAFAAGAVTEIGNTVEKQHKETKDRIQKGTDFAYQSGLPFYKKQKDQLRRLTQLSSEVQNLGLNDDQVEMVMGQSEASITDFLKSSRAEVARTGGTFKPASQVVVGEGGVTSTWQDVQMGTIDPTQISSNVTRPDRSSILGNMLGIKGSGSDEGYQSLVTESASTLEDATGMTLQQAQAAAQGAYTYGDATRGTITLADSSASVAQTSNEMSVEAQQINLKFAKQTQVGKLSLFHLQLKQATTASEKAEMQAEIDNIMQPARLAAAEFAVDENVSVLELQNQISTWERNSLRNYYGDNAQEGLHIATVSLDNMLRSDNPDPEKVKLLEDTINLQNMSIGATTARNLPKLSFGHFNLSYSAMLERRLNQAFPDPKNRGWTYDSSGTLRLDPSKKMSKEVEEVAREKATYDFLKMARKVVRNGGGMSNHLAGFAATLNISKEQLELPLFPTNVTKIKADTTYLVMDAANSVFFAYDGQEYFDAEIVKAESTEQELQDKLTAESAAIISDESTFTTTPMTPTQLADLSSEYSQKIPPAVEEVALDPEDFSEDYRLHENEQDYYRRRSAANMKDVTPKEQKQLGDMYMKLRYDSDAMTDKEFKHGLDLLRAHGTTYSQLKFAEQNIKALQSSEE